MSGHGFQILYSDIGGVLGTNGWGSQLRSDVIAAFGLAPEEEEIERRHQLIFDSYERGYLTFDSYLQTVFFNKPRDFSSAALQERIYHGSTAWPENIELLARVKAFNGLKVALISNEGPGITEHRIGKFGLKALADFMVVSHYVHMRKPDPQIWQLALDLAQATAQESIYIDDRELFVKAAADLGFTAFQHVSLEQTERELQKLGLKTKE